MKTKYATRKTSWDGEEDAYNKWEWRQVEYAGGLMYVTDDFRFFANGYLGQRWGEVAPNQSKLYITFGDDFDVVENLENRTRRPHTLYRKFLNDKVFPTLGVEAPKLSWSQKCGCTMCPCSPGFIINGNWVSEILVPAATGLKAANTDARVKEGLFPRRADISVRILNADFENYDSSKPARTVVAL